MVLGKNLLWEYLIFKKKKLPDVIEIVKSGIKMPKAKYTIKMSSEQFGEFSSAHNENFKTTEMLSQKNYKSLIGKIVGYHPSPKDIKTALTAVVEWPVYKKSERNYVVDCTLACRTSGSDRVSYPIEGTWIHFREVGEAKDTDGQTRLYGLAETIFMPESVEYALKK